VLNAKTDCDGVEEPAGRAQRPAAGDGSAQNSRPASQLGATPGRILIIDDDENFCLLAQRILQGEGHSVSFHHDGESGLAHLSEMIPDVLCLNLGLPDGNGLAMLAQVLAHQRLVSVIALPAESTEESVVTASRCGAWDYLSKPIDRARLHTVVRNAIVHSRMAGKLLHLEREGDGSLAEIERRAIEATLQQTQWSIQDAVRRLGIGRSTLYRKIKQLKLAP
jgi:DNA-binding NtrC family response regulator